MIKEVRLLPMASGEPLSEDNPLNVGLMADKPNPNFFQGLSMTAANTLLGMLGHNPADPLGTIRLPIKNPDSTFGADTVLERWIVQDVPQSLAIMQVLEAERNAALPYYQSFWDKVPD